MHLSFLHGKVEKKHTFKKQFSEYPQIVFAIIGQSTTINPTFPGSGQPWRIIDNAFKAKPNAKLQKNNKTFNNTRQFKIF